MLSPSAGHVDTSMTNDSIANAGPQFLVDLSAIALAEGAATRVPLCMIGTFYKGKRKFSITKKDVAQMAANFRKRGTGDIVMDYEHASEFPEVAAGGPIPAAGWIKSMDDAPDAQGIVWGTVEFTPKAAQMIAAQEYKYVSPVIDWGQRDRSTGESQGATLTSAALTNRPVLDRMPAIRLSDLSWQAGNEENMFQDLNGPESESPVATKTPPDCVTCGTQMMCPKCDSESMKGSEIASKVISLSDVPRDANGRILLSAVARGRFIPVEVVHQLEAERTALGEVDAAFREGKITAAQKPHFEKMALSDMENCRAILSTMATQVDLSEKGFGGTAASNGHKEEIDKLDARLDELARARMKEATVQYHVALKMVASENPQLEKRRTELARELARKGGR